MTLLFTLFFFYFLLSFLLSLVNDLVKISRGLEKNNLQTIEIANNKIADLSGDFFCKQIKFYSLRPYMWSISGLEHMNNLEEFWANNNSVEDFKEVGFLVKVKVIFLCQRSRSWPPTPLFWPCTWNTILFRWAKMWGPGTRYHKDILLFFLLYLSRKLLLFNVSPIFRKTPNTGGKSSLLCPPWLRSTPPYANETPWDDWRNGRTFLLFNHC